MIKNRKSLAGKGRTTRQKKVRQDLLSILESVLQDTDPFELVSKNLQVKSDELIIAGKRRLKLAKYKSIYVVGAGKATYKMALAVETLLGDRLTCGFINIPALIEKKKLSATSVTIARHPTPSQAGVRGSKRIKKLVSGAGKDDLVIGLLSGGGSALLPLPAEGITLSEKTKLTSKLLKTAATIEEINTIRKHLSQIKGGRLAQWTSPATMANLIISDVIGDDLESIASGPTTEDCSTCKQAVNILKKYKVWSQCTKKVKDRLLGNVSEKERKPAQGKVYNFVIGNHQTAVKTAYKAAKKLGYNAIALTSGIQGEAKEVAKAIISLGFQVERYGEPVKKPAILIAGGETTVDVKGRGKGGRNQELVLSGLRYLQSGMTLLSFATDGIDGMVPKPVAGAIADYGSLEKAVKKSLDVDFYLKNNDSYHFFEKIDEHIKTDHTGTNVGDLIILAVI